MRCSASDGEAVDERPFETGTREQWDESEEGEREWDDHKEAEEAGEAASYSLSVAVSVSELIAGQASGVSMHERTTARTRVKRKRRRERATTLSAKAGRRGERCKVKSKTRAWGTIAAPH